MGRKFKRRGGYRLAWDIAAAVFADRGVLRPRDFDPQLNSHHWVHLPFCMSIEQRAPHLYTPWNVHPSQTALASCRGHGAVIGLESALWIAGHLLEEPLPVQIVVPRGSRATRFKDPPIDFHWSDTPDDEAYERRLDEVRVTVHSPARALVDILRIRPPKDWPPLDPRLFPMERVLRLGPQLRALARINAWVEARTRAATAAEPSHPHST